MGQREKLGALSNARRPRLYKTTHKRESSDSPSEVRPGAVLEIFSTVSGAGLQCVEHAPQAARPRGRVQELRPVRGLWPGDVAHDALLRRQQLHQLPHVLRACARDGRGESRNRRIAI